RAGDLAGARAKLDDVAAQAAVVDEALRTIGAAPPTTSGAHRQVRAAFVDALAGWGYRHFADTPLALSRDALAGLAGADRGTLAARTTMDDLAATVAPAITSVERAVAAAGTADDALAVEAGSPSDYRCAAGAVARQAAWLHDAAAAGFQDLEVRFVGPRVQQLGLPLEVARVRLAAVERDYQVVLMTAGLAEPSASTDPLRAAWGDTSTTWALFRLAATGSLEARIAVLLSRHTSLGVTLDDTTGEPIAIAQHDALAPLLAAAGRRAREQAMAARVATGSIPAQTRLHYQVARALAGGDLADRLDALAELWTATRFAETAAMLARNPAPAPPAPPA
ncbi:MAG TPA: hypothetical protein VHE35_12410, partial [Kofleriaceae bacterium]|nr:hypothetical protein [Kofleriaceae bacterium]